MTTFTVTSLNDSGPGSLRAAIAGANASAAPAVLDFAVHGTITLASDLPAISNNVKIDATTAPSYAAGGPPVVELDCNSHAGLVFASGSDGSQLLGVAVDNARGNGVTLNAGSITLNHNYIGLNLAGAAFGNRGDGVSVSASSSNNLIGLNTSGASGAVANVISGNAGNGISFHGSSGNAVVANRIGTNAAGTSAIANGGNGIWITAGSDNNAIGGTEFVDTSTGEANNPTGSKGTVAPVFVVPPLGNLVSGNGRTGILIDAKSQNNVLNGNFVGTTADGNAAIGNAGDGVWINRANNNSLIGCQFVNNPFVYYNVLSGNGGNGLHITDSNNATVQANFFGIGANNTNIVGNRLDGILVDGSSKNTQVGGVIPLGNVAAGNGLNGIEVRDTASGFETFNTFGGLLAFKGAAPNGNDGLLITSTGGNNTVRTNVFSGNLNNGIEIAGDASGVTVDPDIVGLNTAGNGALPNGNNGVQIGGRAHDNVIGGYLSSVIPQNTFSGNDGYGVAILDHAYSNQIFNGFIGSNVFGTVALGNFVGGVLVAGTAHNNTIGGSNSDASSPTANLISGNAGNGVTLAAGTRNIQVTGNSIGLDRFGLPALPNSGAPVAANGNSYNVATPNGLETVFGAGSGTIAGGAGTNYLTVTAAGVGTSNLIFSTGSSDSVFAGAGATTVLSSGSNTQITGDTGSLFVAGEASAETVFGSTASNTTAFSAQNGEYFLGSASGTSSLFIDGGGSSQGGASTVVAGAGALTVFGGAGAYPNQGLIFGGSGALTFVANSGASTVVGGVAQETLFGGSGSYIYLTGGAPAASAMFVAGGGNETLNGSSALVGNQLFAGMNTAGLGSNDSLIGGTGNDTIVGGTGQATMTGGGGNDFFVFNQAAGGGTNTITDFSNNDLLGVFGYGLTARAVVGASSVSGGNTTISLPDHTKITLLGFTNLTTNDVLASPLG